MSAISSYCPLNARTLPWNPLRSCRANTFVWSVVQRHEAILRHRKGDIVVAHKELNFHVTRVQLFHDGSDLATQQVLLGYRFQKGYNVE